MAGRAESSLRSSTAPTQDYDDIVEVVQDTGKLEHTKDSAIKIPFKRRGEDSGRSVSGPIALHDQHIFLMIWSSSYNEGPCPRKAIPMQS